MINLITNFMGMAGGFGNVICGNGRMGIYVRGNNVTLNGFNIYNNGGYGIDILGSNLTVVYNNISNNSNAGIVINGDNPYKKIPYNNSNNDPNNPKWKWAEKKKKIGDSVFKVIIGAGMFLGGTGLEVVTTPLDPLAYPLVFGGGGGENLIEEGIVDLFNELVGE